MWISFALEIAVVALSGYYLYRDSKGNKLLAGLILLMLVSFSGLMLSEWPEIFTNNMRRMTAAVLILYLVFIALAYWSESKNKRTPENHRKPYIESNNLSA